MPPSDKAGYPKLHAEWDGDEKRKVNQLSQLYLLLLFPVRPFRPPSVNMTIALPRGHNSVLSKWPPSRSNLNNIPVGTNLRVIYKSEVTFKYTRDENGDKIVIKMRRVRLSVCACAHVRLQWINLKRM